MFIIVCGGALLALRLGERSGYLKLETSSEYLLSIAMAVILVAVLHEGLHGLGFWIYGGRPSFGFKLRSGFGPAFFTTSKGTLFPRPNMQSIALFPQGLTVVLLIILLSVELHTTISGLLVHTAVLNLAGGYVDIYIALAMGKYPKNYLVEDTQTGIRIYEGR